MRKGFEMIDGVIRWFEDIVCVLCLCGIVITTGMQVVLRYCFHSGILWADEVNQVLMVAMCMFGCAKAIRVKGHTELTAIIDKIKNRKVRISYLVVINIIALAVLVVMFITTVQYTADASTIKSVVLRVPRKYYYSVMPLGLGLSVYEFARCFKSRIFYEAE